LCGGERWAGVAVWGGGWGWCVGGWGGGACVGVWACGGHEIMLEIFIIMKYRMEILIRYEIRWLPR